MGPGPGGAPGRGAIPETWGFKGPRRVEPRRGRGGEGWGLDGHSKRCEWSGTSGGAGSSDERQAIEDLGPATNNRAAGVSHDSPRARTCTFEGPRASQTPQIPREDPQEREEIMKIGGGRRKKSDGGGPNLGAPTKILNTTHNTHNTPHTQTPHTTQHNTTQHNTTQHNTTQHNTTQHNTTQHNTTQHKTRQDKTRQDKTRQDKTRQDKTRQDKTALETKSVTRKTLRVHAASVSDFCDWSGLLADSNGQALDVDRLLMEFMTCFSQRAIGIGKAKIVGKRPLLSNFLAAGRESLGASALSKGGQASPSFSRRPLLAAVWSARGNVQDRGTLAAMLGSLSPTKGNAVTQPLEFPGTDGGWRPKLGDTVIPSDKYREKQNWTGRRHDQSRLKTMSVDGTRVRKASATTNATVPCST